MRVEEVVEEVAVKLLRLAVVRLPSDVKRALEQAWREEENPVGKAHLKNIVENIRLAEELNRPICQDTGTITFYIRAGADFKGLNRVEPSLRRAVERATYEIPLRPNAVNPFTQENSGNNVGRLLPYVKWKIVSGEHLEITAFPKGGGSENTCTLAMLSPSAGVEGLKRFVLESVLKAGGMPCPPTIIGVGVGGGADISMNLAKEALLRPLDEPNPDPTIASLEEQLYREVNALGIGPMGLGGKFTTLAVKVNYAHRHPASYPVAVAFQCWAARRASARIHPDGSVEYLTHRVEEA